MTRPGCPFLCGLALFAPAAGSAAGEPAALSPLTVVAASPLPGSGLDADLAPGPVASLSAADLRRDGPPDLVGALSGQLATVSIGDNLDDPFQPDILLRGFEASPVLGTPQGVAVYQNGVRTNEAFGDTVEWDLIPDIAIRRLDVLGSDPVFGLNALGGALVVRMKTGFSDPGGEVSVSGGAFGRRDITAEYGAHPGSVGVYLAARGLDSDGWREFSPDRLRQAYGDLAFRSAALDLDLSVTAADNDLHGQSAAPVQELAVNRALVFTSPQETADRLAFITLNAAWRAAPSVSLQGALYYRGFWQRVVNGDTTADTACAGDADAGHLCQSDGLTPLATSAGAAIPDLSDGGRLPIGQIDRERIDSTGFGGSVQATLTAPLLGRANHFLAGASVDRSVTEFSSEAEVGVIDPSLRVAASGVFVDTPENTPFSATPVSLRAAGTDLGLFATDTFSLTPRLAITASGRYNLARIDLLDRRGADLSGDSRYGRLNPALGAAYRISGGVTLYGGYSEGSRAPNPSEIECSNPLNPCLLPSSLASDPPRLKAVVSRTWEAGLRVHAAAPGGRVSWNADLFRTDVADDIYGAATSLSAGYFQNIGGTRRQGVELGGRYDGNRLDAYLSYSHVEATFRSAFLLPSPSNPFADAAGDIAVRPGDPLPGIPRDRLKMGADLRVRPGWSLGATLMLVGDQTYFGDEGGRLAPLPGYAVVGLHGSVRLRRRLTMFATVQNLLNARYATFGILGDPTGVGAPGVPAAGADPRFKSPAAPLSVVGGLRLSF